ncbi:AGAP001513-PA-like protein [Anopheles sinensis]|uniref:AGAP001513-PA-like protein n=1 Tax=Anopheles sinensis TaxID=74873 RepID=A0A084W530_ANOSI|nr:AGAP001513-PA-like protein [Anopheles sinensis]
MRSESYDAETNEWTQISPVNYSRAGACVVAIPNSATGAVPSAQTAIAPGGNPASPSNAIASTSTPSTSTTVANNSTTV